VVHEPDGLAPGTIRGEWVREGGGGEAGGGLEQKDYSGREKGREQRRIIYNES